MRSRVPAAVALAIVMLVVVEVPGQAQPVPPTRPRSNPFQNLFVPQSRAVPNAGFRPGGGAGVRPAEVNLPGGLGPPLALLGPDGKAAPYLVVLVPSQPAVFGNLGHWYSRTGNLGHWYPGGFRGGLGALSTGGGQGGFIGPLTTGGMGSVGPGMGGFGGPVGLGAGMPGLNVNPIAGVRLGGR